MDKEDDTDEFSWIMLYLALEVSGGVTELQDQPMDTVALSDVNLDKRCKYFHPLLICLCHILSRRLLKNCNI